MLSQLSICMEQALVYIPLVMGSYLSISLMKIPDLSLESAFTAGAIGAYHVLKLQLNIGNYILLPLVIVVSCVGGMLVGLVSSFLTSYCRFAHLLSSIITTGLFHGVNLLLLGTCNASFVNCSNPFVSGTVGSYITERYIIMLVVGVLYTLFGVVTRSQLGISFSIYGRNKKFFERHGISERYVFMMGVILSNGLVGISGFLCSYTQGFVDTGMGMGIALLALTALILGKVLLSQKMALYIPVVGTLAYFIIQQTLLHVGFDLKFFTTVQAFLVLGILVVYYRSGVRQTIDHLGV